MLSTGDAWVAHAWGSDVYQVSRERPTVKFYIPEEGGIRGSDTAVLLAGAKHPIAAQLFMNHLLDAKVAPQNTNFIGYMGPNAAAKQFIEPCILEDPTVNPDQAVIDSLVELLDLGADLDEVRHRAGRRSAPVRSRLGAGPLVLPGHRLAGPVLPRPAGDHLHRQPGHEGPLRRRRCSTA